MKTVLKLMLILFMSIQLNAQESHLFKGKILEMDESLEGATVTVYFGQKVLSSYTTTDNGKFFFFAMPELEYVLEFSKAGYQAVRYVINTENTSDLGYAPPAYKLDVQLKKLSNTQASEAVDFPIALINYDTEEEEYKTNKKYSASLNRYNSTLAVKD